MRQRRYLTRRKQEEQDFELNIASLIDCFTVLITFLLISASFISLGVIDSTSTENAAGATAATEQESVELSIELKANRNIAMHVTGAAKEEVEVKPLANSWDISGMEKTIGTMKTRWPTLNSADLGADTTVEYREVIHAMEKIRVHIPNVYLNAEDEQ